MNSSHPLAANGASAPSRAARRAQDQRLSGYRTALKLPMLGVALATSLALSACGGGSTEAPTFVAPAGLSYTSQVEVFLAGVQIPPIPATLESGSGGLIFSVEPELPPGLTLHPSTGEISGIPNAPAARATYAISADHNLGSVSADLEIEIRAEFETPRFAYTLHLGDSLIGQWRIDAATGELHNLGAVRTGIIPYRLVSDPLGRFLYVSTHLTQAVGVHRIDPQTGLLDPIELQLTEGGSVEMVIDPTGRFLYVANLLLNSVQSFAIDSTSGALSPVGQPFPLGSPSGIAIDPEGEHLFVTSYADDLLAIYDLDPVGGQIRLLEHAIGLDSPFGLELAPNGDQLYATNFDSAAVTLVDVSIPSQANIVGAWPTGSEPLSVEITQAGQQLHVGCANPGRLFSFAVDSTGFLQDRGSQALEGLPSSLRELGGGERLAVSLYDTARLQLFDLDPIEGPQPGDYRPTHLEFTDLHVVRAAKGHRRETGGLFTANISHNSVSAFNKTDGNANFIASGPDTWVGDSPSSVVADLENGLLVVNAQLTGLLTPFELGSDGTPLPLPPENSKPTGSLPRALALTQGGRFLLTAGNAGVLLHRVEAEAGDLVDVFGVQAGKSPADVVVHPSDRFAFVANRSDGNVQVFALDLVEERLDELASFGLNLGAGSEPRALAVSPDGSRLAVACAGSGVVHLLRIDPVSGKLSEVSSHGNLNDPRSLSFDRDGSHLAIAEYGANQLRLLELLGNVVLNEVGTAATAEGPHAVVLGEQELVVASFVANRIETFAWQPNGTLSPLDTFSLAAGAGPVDATVGFRWTDL